MLSQKEIRKEIMSRLEDRSIRLGIRKKVLQSDFDLIRSGLLDSMKFIQFVVELEKDFNVQIDFDKEDPRTFTSLSGLSELIHKSQNT